MTTIKPRTLVKLILLLLVLGSQVFSQSRSAVGEVPFEFFKNEILVQAKINGQGPFTMLVDTGTDPSAIDMTTARQIGIKLPQSGRAASGGGTSVNTAYKCKFSLVEIGDLKFANIDAGAIDLTKIGQRLERHIDGVIGHSLLNHKIIQFDFPAKRLRFTEKSPIRQNDKHITTLVFRYEDGVMVDGVVVNGKPVTAILDTGSNGTFAVSPMGIDLLRLADLVARSVATRSVGYNGEFETHEGRLGSVVIGDISVVNGGVKYFGKGSGHDSARWELNIGNVFLKDYVVTIDYPRKKILLERMT